MKVLVNRDDLKEWAGIHQKARLIQWLNKMGIPWAVDADGWPCTTLPAITNALEKSENEEVEFL